VTIRFTNGTQQHSQLWQCEAWNRGEEKTSDTSEKLQWAPTSYDIEIHFPDTSFVFHNVLHNEES